MKCIIGCHLVIMLLFASIPCFAEDSVTITYLGNEGFLIQSGSTTVLIDGIFTESWGKYHTPPKTVLSQFQQAVAPFEQVDGLLITHNHPDHINQHAIIEHLQHHSGTTIVAPSDVTTALRRTLEDNIPQSQIIDMTPELGGQIEIMLGRIPLTAIRLPHNGDQTNTIQHVGFLFSLADMTFFHAGDATAQNAQLYQTLELGQKTIDIAFLPHWFFEQETENQGQEIIRYLAPKAIIMMHLPTTRYQYYRDLLDNIKSTLPPVYLMEQPLEALNVYRSGEHLEVVSVSQ